MISASFIKRSLVRIVLLGVAIFVGGHAVSRLSASVPTPDQGRSSDPLVTASSEIASGAPAGIPARIPNGTQNLGSAKDLSPAEDKITPAETLTVRKGDTLGGLLARAGIDGEEAYAAVTALRKVFNPRALKPAQEISVTVARDQVQGGAPQLLNLQMQSGFDRDVVLARLEEGGFEAREIVKKLDRVSLRAGGEIENSLYLAATRAGVPLPILTEMIRAYSFDVDFQRDIQAGDRFEVMFEVLRDVNGVVVGHGDMLYGSMTLSGKKMPIYQFTPSNGVTDYFDPKGASVRKALLRTPVDGARLTSRFGKRRHPILGYTKMHRGIDFGAASGTPIMAAGDGVVAQAGRNGGYGNYIRIRHNSEFSTAYAHLKGLARGIHSGKRIRQGEIIGYVGSTGNSTGPHLHYEVMRSDRQVNPLSVKLPTGETLAGGDLAKFRTARADIDRRFAALTAPVKLASTD